MAKAPTKDNIHIYHIDKIGFDLIKGHKLKAAVMATNPDRPTLLDGDLVEFICLNSKGEVEEFSPRFSMYISCTLYLPTAYPGLEHTEETKGLYIVSLQWHRNIGDEDER